MKNFTHPLFDNVIHLPFTLSTMDYAQQMMRSEDGRGNFLIIADQQRSGKGRQDAAWFSPLGGLWFTAAIFGLVSKANLTIFTGISLHKIIIGLYPALKDGLKLKWPNDLYYNDKKIAGIITQHYPHYKYHCIGIGINTNVSHFPDHLHDNAGSLMNILGKQVENGKLLAKFCDEFGEQFPEFIENSLDIDYFNQNSLLNGKQITLDTSYEHYTGIARGINQEGALLIELSSKMVQPFYSGTVTKVNF